MIQRDPSTKNWALVPRKSSQHAMPELDNSQNIFIVTSSVSGPEKTFVFERSILPPTPNNIGFDVVSGNPQSIIYAVNFKAYTDINLAKEEIQGVSSYQMPAPFSPPGSPLINVATTQYVCASPAVDSTYDVCELYTKVVGIAGNVSALPDIVPSSALNKSVIGQTINGLSTAYFGSSFYHFTILPFHNSKIRFVTLEL
jgi:hypothetical protein